MACLSLLALSLTLASMPLQAGAKFQGATGYQVTPDRLSVTLRSDAIQNTSGTDATGTLLLKLWAFDAPYSLGSKETGTLLGSYKLSGLNPGNRYAGIDHTVPLTHPGLRKSYVICLTLSEFQKGGYVTVDWRNMSPPAVLGPLPLFELSRPWTWQTSDEGGTIDLSVAKISHHRNANTGSLRLSVWALREPYDGVKQNGFELGHVDKAALQKGYTYSNVQDVLKFAPPPDGRYYVCLILSEFQDRYREVAYLNSTKASVFRKP